MNGAIAAPSRSTRLAGSGLPLHGASFPARGGLFLRVVFAPRPAYSEEFDRSLATALGLAVLCLNLCNHSLGKLLAS